MVGLLGPNGAGKTTTVSMIAGLLAPDRGEVRIEGGVVRGETDPVKLRLGLVPQEVALHDELSARENLALFGAIYNLRGAAAGAARWNAAFDVAGLADRAKDRVSTFSGGMKRRLNLAAALLHGPRILLLDEPTVGVDPQSRNQIFSSLEELKRQGKTLVYTTHYMEEAERLCDRIIIIDHGKVIANDTLDAVRRMVPERERARNRRGESGPRRLVGWLARGGWRVGRGVGRQHAARDRAGSAGEFAARAGVAARAGLSLQPPDQPARGPGDGVPDIDRKERTQRMSYTAFQALVRRDLRLFFHGQARGDHEFRRAHRDRVVLRIHLRRRDAGSPAVEDRGGGGQSG